MLEVLQDDFSLPTDNQQIVKILSSRGNNLHEVEDGVDGSTFLVSMPTKFRKNVWVKRGDFVLVEPIEEGDKVKAEIVKILTNEHVKYFKKEKVFPARFVNEDQGKSSEDDLFVNTNRPVVDDDSDSQGSSDNSDSDPSHEDESDNNESDGERGNADVKT